MRKEHESAMNTPAEHRTSDPDLHKGAIEGDRPSDSEQQGNPHGTALDADGLPDDPIAIAEDVEGAKADGTQG